MPQATLMSARVRTGEHFGTLLTLSSGEKKRPFSAITATSCELAIISRVGYNRILKKQLQGAIAARISLLQSLNIMNTQSYGALQRVATNCQDETFLAGVCQRHGCHASPVSGPASHRSNHSLAAGVTIIDPTLCPSKIYVIMEGGYLGWVWHQCVMPGRDAPGTCSWVCWPMTLKERPRWCM